MDRFVAAFKHWFPAAEPARRIAALGVLLTCLAVLGFGLRAVLAPADWQPLYPDLSPRAAGETLAALEQLDIPARVDPDNGQLEVPARQRHMARMRLAARGLPRSEAGEVLPEPRLGVSSRMEQAQLQVALEHSLAASIATLDNVREARVHLTLARPTPLLREGVASTAAVLVHLRPGTQLTPADADAIRTLVASAVPRLDVAGVRLLVHAAPAEHAASPGVPPTAGAAPWLLGIAGALCVGGFLLWRRARRPVTVEPGLDACLARLRRETLANPALTAEVIRQWLR